MNVAHQRDPRGGSAKRRRGRDPSQFGTDAASLVVDEHRTSAGLVCELGVNEETLGTSRPPGADQPRRARRADPRGSVRR